MRWSWFLGMGERETHTHTHTHTERERENTRTRKRRPGKYRDRPRGKQCPYLAPYQIHRTLGLLERIEMIRGRRHDDNIIRDLDVTTPLLLELKFRYCLVILRSDEKTR